MALLSPVAVKVIFLVPALVTTAVQTKVSVPVPVLESLKVNVCTVSDTVCTLALLSVPNIATITSSTLTVRLITQFALPVVALPALDT
jgi:hypothetical protein